MPRVGSLFSGVGGIDLAFQNAGFDISYQVEIDKFCSRVLEHHFPNVKRFGDIKEVKGEELPEVDILSGGFPCVDVSVAGKRAGLAGTHTGLWWEFHRIITET